jgi:hypothetical protein
MNVNIKQVAEEAQQFILQQASEKKFGDITVTITMNDGVPVKLTNSFCEHISKRRTTKLVVEK